MLKRAWVAIVGAALLGACAGDSPEISSAALAPPGSDAEVVGHTIPTSMHPGERLDVTVTMRNTGTAGPSNTWTMSGAQHYAFHRVGPNQFNFTRDPLESATVPVGGVSVHHFVLTAPTTPGTYSFSGRMGIVGDENFGETLTVPAIVVDPATPRRWGCSFVSESSSIPTMIAPGETRSVSIAVQNTGTATWTANDLALYSQDVPASLWANTIRPLTTAVASGGTATFAFSITAPGTPGTYSLRRQMLHMGAGSVGFLEANPCVSATIEVGGGAQYDAAVLSHTLPAVLAPGEVRSVSVTVTNSGALDWPNDGSVALYSQNSPTSLYGTTLVTVSEPTAAGASTTLNFVIRAPTTAGTYQQSWRMRKLSGTHAGPFGATLTIPLTVDESATPMYAAVIAGQAIPMRVTAGRTATFSVDVQNAGTASWSGSAFRLYSTNTPTSLWGITGVALGAMEVVDPGVTRSFALNVTAPSSAGTYESRWRMAQAPGLGLFGAEAVAVVEVTLCGNGTLDAGEACDDSNLNDGDGCDASCRIETQTFDLLTASMDRTLLGTQANRQLGNVTIGDVTGDGVADVLVAENATVIPGDGGRARALAGTVYGFTGGASFFTNSSTVVSDGALFRVLGAGANDYLGATSTGGIVVGDVTGDGVPDLVVSAAFADGEMDSRIDAGEVYVLSGGAALTGDIDLGAPTAPAALTARVIGAAAGDQLKVLAAADLTGDGVLDLVLGAPFSSTANGEGSGAVFVVEGGPALSGTIDLAAPTVSVLTIAGPAAGANLGMVGAVGDYSGDGEADLLLGAARFAPGGRTRSGGAWALTGPLVGDRDLSAPAGVGSGPDVAWFGLGVNDIFGAAVAIGNVTGTSSGDVLIGAPQHRRGPDQVGAVLVWAGPLASGSTFDLSTGAAATAEFRGADPKDNAGTSLAVGDMNGDGYMEIPVVSVIADGPADDRDRAGELQVFLGGPAVEGTVDLGTESPIIHVYGAEAVDLLGAHAGNIAFGDIDGDGHADLCIGSYQGGPDNSGRIDCLQSVF